MEYLPAFDKALKDIILSIHNPAKDFNVQEKAYYIGLEGSFGEFQVNPRNVSSKYLGKMVCIEGIITRCKYLLLPFAFYWRYWHVWLLIECGRMVVWLNCSSTVESAIPANMQRQLPTFYTCFFCGFSLKS